MAVEGKGLFDSGDEGWMASVSKMMLSSGGMTCDEEEGMWTNAVEGTWTEVAEGMWTEVAEGM